MNLLDIPPKKGFQKYITEVKSILDVTDTVIEDYAQQSLIYYTASKENREKFRNGQYLEHQWYHSLAKGKIDYSLYGVNAYLGDLWACWKIYSRSYLRAIRKSNSFFNKSILEFLGDVFGIVDLGCGTGLTTEALQELFPTAKVFGTNLDNTSQMLICRAVEKRTDLNFVSELNQIKIDVGLVFASEYFEHFYKPIAHLHNVIDILSPKNLLIANAFGAQSMGHFPYYEIDGKNYAGKMIGKIFNSEMRRLGYRKIKTKLWNNRPNYWKKIGL